jgi:hypothetical protein
VIVAGSRYLASASDVAYAIALSGFNVTEVVSGGAPGADALGEQWARSRAIPVQRFPAEWHVHGRSAGPIRNRAMAAYADALVALWDGASPGTGNMISAARAYRLRVHVHRVSPRGA